MIVIAIIGILAAIALPAYAKYMARARFTEVTSAVDGVKKQVELCIFDLGQTNYAANSAITVNGSCANGQSGSGWRIGTNTDYATKYVHDITVSENGEVTATAVAGNGLNSAKYKIVPMNGASATDNGIIDWVKADGIAHGSHTAVTKPTDYCGDVDLC